MSSFLLMFLKEKLVAHLFLIQLLCVYPLGLLETVLLLLYTVISRSVPEPDVFLLTMQSVGASTSLIQIVFGSLLSVSFLNKNNCSLSLCHLFVFNCFLLCVILFSVYCLPVISSPAVVKHLSKWIELINIDLYLLSFILYI
jgi:hypothetical protein